MERRAEDGVSVVAGQSEIVDYPRYEEQYPETTDQTGETGMGAGETGLVSVAGLKNRRSSGNLNQSQLATRSGVRQGTISQAEKSGRATRRTARKLAGALGVRVEELAQTEQRSRFPERSTRGTTTVTYSEEGTIRCAADSSPAAREEKGYPVTVELSEPVLQRVDRFLDLLEWALRPRSSGA